MALQPFPGQVAFVEIAGRTCRSRIGPEINQNAAQAEICRSNKIQRVWTVLRWSRIGWMMRQFPIVPSTHKRNCMCNRLPVGRGPLGGLS